MRNVKETLLYILKRLALMVFTFVIIFILCFVLIRLLPLDAATGAGKDPSVFYRFQVALGRMYYDPEAINSLGQKGDYLKAPVIQQFFKFIKTLFVPERYVVNGEIQTVSRWGYSWNIIWLATPESLLFKQLPPTILINIYSMVFSIPIGLALGTYMALKKNKWQDNVLSVLVMILISVPSFVYAFLLQWLIGYKLGWLPPIRAPFETSWFSPKMFSSMILPVLAMSFGSIAGYSRYTRAELTEVLTSDFMLLARTKGLSRAQATVRHAFRNSLVPIFPMILGEILSILSGSIIIEQIFSINGVGALYLTSIQAKDYDVFQFISMFYIFIGLLGGLVVDVSYGLVDPRIRMGGGKQ
ncbi:MAG: ABC transporter permease [Bacilli bacterium]|nr:ABC transporter permease [Bacilli bacterium]